MQIRRKADVVVGRVIGLGCHRRPRSSRCEGLIDGKTTYIQIRDFGIQIMKYDLCAGIAAIGGHDPVDIGDVVVGPVAA